MDGFVRRDFCNTQETVRVNLFKFAFQIKVDQIFRDFVRSFNIRDLLI